MTRNVIQTDALTAGVGGNWTQQETATRGNVVDDTGNSRVTGQFSASGNDSPSMRWTGSGTFTNDQYSSVSLLGLSILTSTVRAGVRVRCGAGTETAGISGYEAYIQYDGSGTYTTILAMHNGATFTTLNSGTLAWANTDLISIEVQGTTIRLCKNGTPIGGAWTQTDSTLTTGQPGVLVTASAFVNTWEGGSITSSSGSPTMGQMIFALQ